MHKVKLTERVPQHPKSKRKDFRDKVGSDREMLPRQLSNKATTDCYVPCAGAFRSFGHQKNITETTTMIIATNGKGKNYEEYKIIRYKNTVFLTPPSSEQALNPPPLKEEELS